MTHLADLLTDLIRHAPGSPRITWYVRDGGPQDGERVELSGAVLANWASKAANLLQDELDAAPGTRVRLDLPPHWRALYWAVAAWAVGATVTTSGDAEVLVTTDPAGAPAGAQIVVVTPAALARAASVALPAGAVDEARELATFGDAVTAWDRAQDDDPALDDPALTFEAEPAASAERLLLPVSDTDRVGPWLARVVPVLLAGGSVVVVRTGPGTTPAGLERVAAQERATILS